MDLYKNLDGSYHIMQGKQRRACTATVIRQLATSYYNDFVRADVSVTVKRTHHYDYNGNLKADSMRGITSIVYNDLNLPQTVVFNNGDRIGYIYSADGTKLRETYYRRSFSLSSGVSQLAISSYTDYLGSYEFVKGTPYRLNLPRGYMTLGDNVYHHYQLDYQGNVMGVINTASRTLEQRTGYYPYGLPHDNSTGAGLNNRKYSGKELQTYAGLNSMDYHARWRPTVFPMFDTPDPKAHIYSDTNPYIYCGGDPVNRVDPTGMDEFDISASGEIVNVTRTNEHDAVYILNEDGVRTKEKSISFKYGTILNSHANQNWDGHRFNIVRVRGDSEGKSLFEFLARNTGVEWSNIMTGKPGNQGLNFLTTSFNPQNDYGSTSLLFYQLKDGYTVRSHSHSHPSGTPYPSGLLADSDNEHGDIYFAKIINCLLNASLHYSIFVPQSSNYIIYDENSTIFDFDYPIY